MRKWEPRDSREARMYTYVWVLSLVDLFTSWLFALFFYWFRHGRKAWACPGCGERFGFATYLTVRRSYARQMIEDHFAYYGRRTMVQAALDEAGWPECATSEVVPYPAEHVCRTESVTMPGSGEMGGFGVPGPPPGDVGGEDL